MAAKLSLVRDADTPAGEPPAGATTILDLPGRRAALTQEHDNAAIAALDPDVVQQQRAAIAKAMRAAGQEDADLRAILLDLTRRMFVLGYMNGAADQKQVGHLELTDATLAEVIKIEAVERKELPAKERALRAVKP